ncbi:hypothetical protein JCM5296_004763 [Sporobolomyces johnsonii]
MPTPSLAAHHDLLHAPDRDDYRHFVPTTSQLSTLIPTSTPSRPSAMARRSSADIYASVPTSDSTYPPIRSVNPRSPDISPPSTGYSSHDYEITSDPMSPPPPFAEEHASYPTRRSDSQQTFGSDYSSSEPYRLRGGTNASAWDARIDDGYDSTPHGSSANLNAMAYRNVANRGDSYRDKEEDDQEGQHVPTLKNRLAAAGAGGAGAGAGAGKAGWWARQTPRARKLLLLGLLAAIIVVAVVVAVPSAVVSSRNKNNTASNKDSQTNDGTQAGIPTSANPVDWKDAAVGGNGSTVYIEGGGSFTYNNSFGGYWVSIPFNDTARPQRDVPALNEEWDYEANLINGVNIGGWLVLEPFIVPGMFEPFNSDSDSPTAVNNAIDEWTLSEQLGSNLTAAMTEHYETFITEQDFAQIAGAGLNWVRIPIGWWAVETWDGEPFLAGVAWTYFLKAVEWARKYGLRINLDLHAVPGSQNGYNHSGKQGTINFLNGVMGVANAQRTLNYIRTLTEFISQPEYKNVVPMFSVLNEPYAATIGVDVLRHFYIETYNQMRAIGGTGTGNGPFLTFHDGFVDMATNVSSGGWDGFLNGWDRVALDSHRYLCFSEPNDWSLSYQAGLPCNYWAENMNISTNTFGVTIGGEWSLAINDCGKWLNNVGNGQRYNGTYYVPGNTTAPEYAGVGSCEPWNDWPSWSDATKAGLKMVAEAHMDALRHWFFWTWKTGYSTQLGMIANPMWNYQLGLEQGWVPTNPRTAIGVCPGLASSNELAYTSMPAPTLSAWMTGGSGAGTILDEDMYTSFSAWPPASVGVAATPASFLPTYTPTGSVITMSAPAEPTSFPSGYASSSINVGNGWEQSTDTAGWYTPVAGCTYPDPWSGVAATIPTAACTGSAAAARMKREAKRTASSTALTSPTPPPKPAATRRA